MITEKVTFIQTILSRDKKSSLRCKTKRLNLFSCTSPFPLTRYQQIRSHLKCHTIPHTITRKAIYFLTNLFTAMFTRAPRFTTDDAIFSCMRCMRTRRCVEFEICAKYPVFFFLHCSFRVRVTREMEENESRRDDGRSNVFFPALLSDVSRCK